MPIHDKLGIRMKKFYEQIPQTKLMRRTPVAIRLDGKAFHTFAKHLQKPFDSVLMMSMQETMRYLCKNIQGCVLGYTQSDEITLILVDYKRLDSDAWFDYKVQKMCSIASSMATLAFNRAFDKYAGDWIERYHALPHPSAEQDRYYTALNDAMTRGAMFDARCFNVPVEEVANLLYWRQTDAIRNSVQMVGQAYFPHRRLQNKTCEEIKSMLLSLGIDWNTFPTYQKRGSCCIKTFYTLNGADRSKWIIDNDIPVFKDEGRAYVESRILIGEE